MGYSLDFRQQVFKIKQKEGLTFQEASDRFGVPIRTLFRWQNRIAPKTKRDKPSTKIDMEALRKDVKDNPDHFQYERAKKFGVSQSAIYYALRRLKISHKKKTLFHPKAVWLKRLIFQLKIFRHEFVEQRPIVYVDESGFAVDAPRGCGFSTRGQRCFAGRDWHARGRVNAIGAITDFKLFNVCLFDTYINADVFYGWLTQELIPNAPENSVIVLDNATFHKRADAMQAIELAGLTAEFLPPYSPDLNPIEKKWAQAKSIRRKFGYNPDDLFLYSKL